MRLSVTSLRSLVRLALITEGRVEDLTLKHPNVPVGPLAAGDPSPTKKYLEWMVKQAASGAREEDIVPTIKYFHDNAHKFPSKDINAYRTLKDLEDAAKLASSKKTPSEEKRDVSSEAPRVYEDDSVIVVRPDTKRSCVKYGKGTKWCITMGDAGYYEQYTGANVVFYFLLSKVPTKKNHEKLALAVMRDAKNSITGLELYDAADRKIDAKKNVPAAVLGVVTADAKRRPKSVIARLKSSKESVSPDEIVAYWKTLPDAGTPEALGARIAILSMMKGRDPLMRAVLGAETDPETKEIIGDLIDGTARITNDDNIVYENRNGELHRAAGQPAEIWADGSRFWFRNGKLHRDGDQPAAIHADGSKFWYRNEELHRDGDQPAVIDANGTKGWFRNGQLHRDGDQPALIWANGTKEWYRNGKRHRDGDQPAEIWADGTKYWYRNGREYTPKKKR